MLKGEPVIVMPALWHAGEKVFGKPDLIVHTTWLRTQLESGRLTLADPLAALELQEPAPFLGDAGAQGHYVVINLVFSAHLEDRQDGVEGLRGPDQDPDVHSGPASGLHAATPTHRARCTGHAVPVAISALGAPLDQDLAAMRDQFIEIKVKGGRFRPWRDAIVANNPKHTDEQWARAKAAIARHPTAAETPPAAPYRR